MKRKNFKKPMISALEQRILFDGAAVATAVDVLDESSFSSNNNTQTTTNSNDVTQNNAENSVHEAQAVQGFERPRREVAFVDVTVKDYQTLVDGVGEGTEVYLVSSLDEIKTTLSSQTNIDAIHILSHGNTGEISVGNDLLNSNTLDDNAQLLEIMKNSLSENGDILLYGCNVASDGTGQEFINSIATLTQADVAASDDITGNSALGGDWELEKSSGSIETDNFEIVDYDGKLVTTTMFDFSTESITGSGTKDSFIIRDSSTHYALKFTTADTSADPWAVFQSLNDGSAGLNTTYAGNYLYISNLSAVGAKITVTADMNNDGVFGDTFKINSFNFSDASFGGGNYVIKPNGIATNQETISVSGLPEDITSFIPTTSSNFDGITSLEIQFSSLASGIIIDNLEIALPTVSDTTPPTFGVAPATSNVTATTVDLSASLNEAGKIYYVVVPNGSTAPTVAEVKAGTAFGGASAISSGNNDVTTTPFTGTFNITGLSADTAYDIYVVGQDDEGTPNVMATATKVDVITSAAPTSSIAFEPVVANEQNINSGLVKLTNNGYVSLQLRQVGGDLANDPYINIFDGNVAVYDSSNQLIKEISLTPNVDENSFIGATSMASLENGGFVVVWTDANKDWDSLQSYAHYQVYDNEGNAVGSSVQISTTNSNVNPHAIDVVSISNGGFAVAFTTSNNNDVLALYSYNAGSYTKINEQTVFTNADMNNHTTDTATDTNANFFITVAHPKIVELSDGSFILVDHTYLHVSPTYTPLGDYMYKFDSSGNRANFADGNWAKRIDWMGGGDVAKGIDIIAFENGGFGIIASMQLNPTVQTTIWVSSTYDNDGTVRTTNTLTQQVYNLNEAGDSQYHPISIKGVNFASNTNFDMYTENATDKVFVSEVDGKMSVLITNSSGTLTEYILSEADGSLISSQDIGISLQDNNSKIINPYRIQLSNGQNAYTFEEYNYDTGTRYVTSTDYSANIVYENSITFNFESGVAGMGTKTVTQTLLGETLQAVSTSQNLMSNYTLRGAGIVDLQSLATDSSSGSETFITFSLQGNKKFDLKSLNLGDYSLTNESIILTSSKGTITLSSVTSINSIYDISSNINASYFEGITSFTVTATDGNINNLAFDEITIDNIIVIAGPTVSAATGTYTDNAANDTGFTNTTGTISATASGGSITGYGISGGTTGGSDVLGDVSKVGTYGTLYVNSSTGAYAYVPTSDSVINATSSTVTDVFTIQATDSNGTGNGTLTITINGVNDTPVLTTPTSASYTDTSATDTFTNSNTTGTLTATDRDTGATLTYGINTGTTGGNTDVGGVTYDVSKAGTYGTLYVVSTGADKGKYVYVPNASAINGLTSNATDTFTVSSSDGSANDTQTFTVNITGVNDTPSAADKTITINEDTPTLLTVSDFGFSDVDTGSALLSVKIVSLSSNGTLEYYDGSSWVAVIANQVITNADITANKLRFNPALNENGNSYATFDFTVNDGTVDSTAKTITYNVTAVNDAPTVANTITDQNASVSNAFSFEVPLNTFADVDTSDTLTYTAQLVDSNGDLVSGGTLPSWLSFDANTRTFSGTPVIGDAGIIYIKVTATDNGTGTLSVSDTFTITTIANKTPIAGFGTGLTFDGSSNYVTVTDSGYTITNTLTMEAWINPTSTAGVQHIMGKWTPLGTSDSVHNSDGYLVAILNGKIAVFLSNNGTNEQNFSSNSSVSSNTWTHVSLTFDSGVAKLYINGVLDKEVNVSGITSLYKSSQDLSIGATHTSSGTSYYFNGQIDEARIWNIARPSTDIQNDMYQTLSGNETGLVGYWNMDEATGTTLVDSSVNSNNGTLVNTPTFTNSNISMSISLDEDTSVSIQTFGGSDADNNGSTQTDTISVKITTLPTNGKLFQTTDGTTSNGTEITSIGTVVTHSGGKVIYIPNENYNGSDSFSYKVNDGAVDSNNTISQNITINSVNDVPTATDKTITINEDTPTLLSVSDFGFSDVDTTDTLTSVKITSLSTHGMLEYNNGTSWVAVSLNQVITATDITDGKLRFNPALNENGTAYATFDFTVNDGTTDSVNANTITYNVTAVNDAPTAIDKTITINEDTPTLLSVSDFGFSDVENDTFTSVKITSLATHGMLEYNNGTSWVVVSLNQVITATDIIDGKLRFNPALNENGTAYATFDFTVNDGTTDSVNANTITYNVTAVNDAPVGTVTISGTVTQGETLTASNNITDADGMGTVSYQWFANGVEISGATGSTYTLTQNEVNKAITVVASYTDALGTAETVTSSATTSVVNVNDAPTVSNDNIDVKLSFGDAYQKDVSGLFSDIDFDNVFTYEAINLPLGLTMNSSTGVISGRANSSGEFKVIIKVTDNGTPALSVSRTYNMLVVAPPQVEISQNTSPKPSVDNTPIVNVNNITISTFTDTLSLGTINNNLGDTPADSVGNGYIDSNRENNNQENNNQPLQVNRTNSSNYIEANASLNVGFNGQISFDNTAQDSFSIVGIAIENMTIENNRLEIRVVDTNLAQNFIVTQIDGTALPTGLSFDPKTGNISGTIPENLDKLEITIKATNPDGTTRVLNLKLDLKELKKSQANQADADEKYMGLKEQIALENQKLDDYGSYLTRLFA